MTTNHDSPDKPTKRVTLDKARLDFIVRGHAKIGDRYADPACTGLSIRVRAKGAYWTFSARPKGGKPSTWSVAPLREDDDITLIRRRVDEARKLVRGGIDPAEHFKKWEYGIPTSEEADAETKAVEEKAAANWTWKQGVTAFLKHVDKDKPVGTYRDYRQKLLGCHAPKTWDDRYLCDLTPRDFKMLQSDIAVKSQSTARGTLRVVKAFMSWAANEGHSGLEVSMAAPVKPKQGKPPVKGYTPTWDEIGDMPWLLDKADVPTAAKLCAILILLTAQRRRTAITAACADIVSKIVPGAGDVPFDMWDVPPLGTKVKRIVGELGHVIPLSAPALAVVKAAMAGNNKPWLFPQMRKRNAADDGDGTMAEGTASNAMLDAGVGFTPQAVRRAFAGWAEDIGKFDIKKVQAVLDHAEGRQDVLHKRYSRSEQIALKQEPLEKWAEFVLAHVRRRRPDDRKDDLPACMCGGGVEPDNGDDGDYVDGQARIVRPQFG